MYETKISIIIPVYKTEKYLAECIESVIAQTYENIEIIIVNDGSPDNSEEICKKYLKKDSRIKYFYKENGGVAVARNFGISKATGEYIYCIDSDDTIEKNLIEEIYNSFIETGCDFLIVDLCFSAPTEIIGALPTWGFAVKKELLDKYPDVRFQEGFYPTEDGMFSHKLMALTDNIARYKTNQYNYRTNPDSIERNLDSKEQLKAIPKLLDILAEFYTKYKLWDTHKLHFLAFIFAEPFWRLNSLKLDKAQKKYLANILLNYINKYKLSQDTDINKFPKKFKIFAESKNYSEYVFRCCIENFKNKFIQNIFSVKNEYRDNIKHKNWTILGIKIKYKVCD